MNHKSFESPRVIKTYLNQKPKPLSFIISLSIVLLCGIMSQAYWSEDRISSFLAATPGQVYQQGEYWRLITTSFVHGDFGHLGSNMYMLFILGFFAYGYFGFAVYPFAALILSALINALALLTYPEETRLVGASGMVYFLAGFWLTMFLFIERKYTFGSRILRIFGIGLVILFPSTYEPNVSYRTHGIGLVIGVAFACLYFLKKKGHMREYEEFKTPEPDTDMDL